MSVAGSESPNCWGSDSVDRSFRIKKNENFFSVFILCTFHRARRVVEPGDPALSSHDVPVCDRTYFYFRFSADELQYNQVARLLAVPQFLLSVREHGAFSLGERTQITGKIEFCRGFMKQSTGACFISRSHRADPRRKNRGPRQWSRCFTFRPAPRTQPLPPEGGRG